MKTALVPSIVSGWKLNRSSQENIPSYNFSLSPGCRWFKEFEPDLLEAACGSDRRSPSEGDDTVNTLFLQVCDVEIAAERFVHQEDVSSIRRLSLLAEVQPSFHSETAIFRNLCVNLRPSLCDVQCTSPRKPLISLTLRKMARFPNENSASPIHSFRWEQPKWSF